MTGRQLSQSKKGPCFLQAPAVEESKGLLLPLDRATQLGLGKAPVSSQTGSLFLEPGESSQQGSGHPVTLADMRCPSLHQECVQGS